MQQFHPEKCVSYLHWNLFSLENTVSQIYLVLYSFDQNSNSAKIWGATTFMIFRPTKLVSFWFTISQFQKVKNEIWPNIRDQNFNLAQN